MIDDTPVPTAETELTGTKYEVPHVPCPLCYHELMLTEVKLVIVSEVAPGLVWLMRCPIEGDYYQYRTLP